MEVRQYSGTKAKQGRLYYMDYIRVFAILMVILLHCICEYNADTANFGTAMWWGTCALNELTRAGVPMLFMISGYLLLGSDKSYNIREFYKHRFSKFIGQFLGFSIFYYFFFCIKDGVPFSASGFFAQFFNSGTAYHLWFMYSLFALYLMVPFLKRIVDNVSIKGLLILFLMTVFQGGIKPLVNTFAGDAFYLKLFEDGFVGYAGYMILGYILGNVKLPRITEYIMYAAGLASVALFAYWNGNFAIETGTAPFDNAYMLNHYIIAAAIFILCKNMLNRPSRAVYCGALMSFDVYLIHVFFLELLMDKIPAMAPAAKMSLVFVLTVILSGIYAVVVRILKLAIAAPRVHRARVQRKR